MRILVIGAAGQVGTDLRQVADESGYESIALTRADLDIADAHGLPRILEIHRPDAVVNCSVFHPLEQCEADPQRSFAVNGLALRYLGEAARHIGAVVVHFSSDFVFGGESGRPYKEDDLPVPRSVFGVSKLCGEHLLRNSCPRHFILRTSGLYGHAGSRVKRGNFVETMLRLGDQNGRVRVVSDVRTAPTFTRNVARQAIALLGSNQYGTFHVVDHGDYSWCEFAQIIFRMAGMTVEVEPVSWRDMPGMELRPAYSVLQNRRLGDIGLDLMQSTDIALQDYLATRALKVAV